MPDIGCAFSPGTKGRFRNSQMHSLNMDSPPLPKFFSCQKAGGGVCACVCVGGRDQKQLWKEVALLVLWVKIEAAAPHGLAAAFWRDLRELPAGVAQGTVAV